MPNMAAEPSSPEQLLKGLEPFRDLSPVQQKELLCNSQILELPREAFVFRQGERDNYAYFLLRGTLSLFADGQLVQEVTGGTPAASHPLAQLQPRQMSAHAKTAVSILRTDRGVLDRYQNEFGTDVSPDKLQVAEIVEDTDDDWMTRMLQSALFARVPAANIQRIFTRMEPVPFKAGQVVIQQGGAGDYYYVIREGRCQVTRRGSVGGPAIQLAELGPGDSFGEESLVSDSRRNATVSMVTDGELMRLTKEDFAELIKQPLLRMVNFETAVTMVAKGALWLDVRYPDEHRHGTVAESVDIALNLLRVQMHKLRREHRYIVVCDNGARSAVGAFLLIQRGFNAVHLEGGLVRAGVVTRSDAGNTAINLLTEAETAKVLKFPPPIQTGAPIPASHRSEVELPVESPRRPGAGRGAVQTLEADIRVSALKTELAKANVKLEQALRLKTEAEAARKAVEQQAEQRLQTERLRLQEEAGRAKASIDEAQRQLKTEVEATRKEIEQQAEQRLQAERMRLEEEANKAKASFDETQRLRAELEAARQAIEAESEGKVTAERLLLEEEANKAKASFDETQRLRAELEAARQAIEAEAEQRLAAERQQLAEDARRAEVAIREAQRLKAELEAAKMNAEAEAQRLRCEEEQKIAQLQAEAEQRLSEEKAKLEKAYAWKEEELARVLRLKEETELRLQTERDQLQDEAKEARKRLVEARKLQEDVEQARQAAAAEADVRLQRQQELEACLREEIKLKISEERNKLEAEFARNATALEQAQRERDAAERARQAAAQEAERIIAEYKTAHEKWREDERARLEAERANLEDDARKIESNLAAARRAREEAEAVKHEAVEHLSQLRVREQNGAGDTDAAQRQLRADIAGFEAELEEADRVILAAQRVRDEAEEAHELNVAGMVHQREQEHKLHIELQREIEDWLREQDELENSEQQRHILANQRVHMERIIRRAQAAKEAAKRHDQSLLDELADRLRDWDD